MCRHASSKPRHRSTGRFDTDLCYGSAADGPPSIDHPLPQHTLEGLAGQTITEEGLGGDKALKLFIDTLAPACISEDHPRYLAFVPTAPSEVSTLFDLVVGASNICASSWLEGAGAIYAENQALRWISDIAGFPADAGVFLSVAALRESLGLGGGAARLAPKTS